ncbi:hypothetical protein BDA99DRAFT_537527 [Phascolomyces articulosus]|uniref:Uncharacterized protein n=1 Tax=Phascolomyces articulosus TaxID=60185 RepID=A0AAD5JZP9_9FUNG|nr:hypothetical protein BDA99DRAFT_537527 [Phascolomyces articulosus]
MTRTYYTHRMHIMNYAVKHSGLYIDSKGITGIHYLLIDKLYHGVIIFANNKAIKPLILFLTYYIWHGKHVDDWLAADIMLWAFYCSSVIIASLVVISIRI